MGIALHLLYFEEVFRQNITGRSSDWRIILLVAPSSHQKAESGLTTFVTDYSGGTVPFSPVKYRETTDFHRLHRKNLRNPCNLRLLLNWSWDSLLVPINIGTPVCCYLILHLYHIVSPFRINPSKKHAGVIHELPLPG